MKLRTTRVLCTADLGFYSASTYNYGVTNYLDPEVLRGPPWYGAQLSLEILALIIRFLARTLAVSSFKADLGHALTDTNWLGDTCHRCKSVPRVYVFMS